MTHLDRPTVGYIPISVIDETRMKFVSRFVASIVLNKTLRMQYVKCETVNDGPTR
jgi:hypothetical protein